MVQLRGVYRASPPTIADGHDGPFLLDAQGRVLMGGGGAPLQVAGDVANDAADSGNPVKIGGRAQLTPTAVGDDDRVDFWLNKLGALHLAGDSISGATGADNWNQIVGTQDKTAATAGNANPLATSAFLYNEATWDRVRNNTDITVLASAARTALVTGSDLTNYNARGVHVVFDVTADPAGASLTLTVQGKDSLSGKYYDLLVGSAVADVGTTVYRIGPDLSAVANSVVIDILPRIWRVNIAVADSASMTYSVGASVLL